MADEPERHANRMAADWLREAAALLGHNMAATRTASRLIGAPPMGLWPWIGICTTSWNPMAPRLLIGTPWGLDAGSPPHWPRWRGPVDRPTGPLARLGGASRRILLHSRRRPCSGGSSARLARRRDTGPARSGIARTQHQEHQGFWRQAACHGACVLERDARTNPGCPQRRRRRAVRGLSARRRPGIPDEGRKGRSAQDRTKTFQSDRKRMVADHAHAL